MLSAKGFQQKDRKRISHRFVPTARLSYVPRRVLYVAASRLSASAVSRCIDAVLQRWCRHQSAFELFVSRTSLGSYR